MPADRTRRSVLAAGAGAVALLAGCAGSGDDGSAPGESTGDGSTDGPTPGTGPGTVDPTTRGDVSTVRPLTATYEADGLRVSFRDAWVQRSLLYREASGGVGVAAPGDRQFVFVETAVDPGADGAPTPGDFGVRVRAYATAGTSSPLSGVAAVLPDRRGEGDADDAGSGGRDAYAAGTGRGWIAFPVPRPLPPGDPRLVVHPPGTGRETVVWGLPEDATTALRAPPASLSLSAVEVPDRVAPGDPIPVAVTVHNDGDGDGVCRLACSLGEASTGARTGRLGVPAGGERTWEATLANPVGGGEAPGRVTVAIRTAAGDRRVAVDVEG